ncbi:MAG: hypothetical protein LBK60_12895 [Verrucomicrobiales bacterium]|jgi:hypothetical protein|nr:hypothetical protein [Verrucomicrobiales bacterium]
MKTDPLYAEGLVMKSLIKIPTIVILCGILFILSGCNFYRDLSNKEPYKQVIGKSFVLQQDCYANIYKQLGESNDICLTPLGVLTHWKLDSVNEKYIGREDFYQKIVGVVKTGQVLRITRVRELISFERNSIIYYAKIVNSEPNQANLIELDMTFVTQLQDKIPWEKFSDPPIFRSKYALPLESDGVWWK